MQKNICSLSLLYHSIRFLQFDCTKDSKGKRLGHQLELTCKTNQNKTTFKMFSNPGDVGVVIYLLFILLGKLKKSGF